MTPLHPGRCHRPDHLSRRTLLKMGGLAGLAWLTPLAELLALDAERRPGRRPRSVIMLWLAGGPSQLETFDPHPGSAIAAGTGAIPTSVPGIQLAAGLEQVAGVMHEIALIRSVVSKEGDHERAVYNMKTGNRPDPTVVHPSIGAILAHELPDSKLEIPAHISILPDQWPARGGYFGAPYDAFKLADPQGPLPDVRSHVDKERQAQRLASLDVVEQAFQPGRPDGLDQNLTLHQNTVQRALRMMSSDQLKAFDLEDVPQSERSPYGDTPFGRGCLAARRLVESGVRCVEVTLKGWDSHVNNHETQAERVRVLDPAFAALIRDLRERDLLDDTVVICGGEFGRTPKVNPLGGRDHWPHGFSIAIAGGGVRKGLVLGETDPSGEAQAPADPVDVEDIHATVQHLLGLNPEKEIMTPVGRPIALSEGTEIKPLLG